MSRPRKIDTHLPKYVYKRHGAYYHVKAGAWTRLGSTLKQALGAYAALFEAPEGTLGALINEALLDRKPHIRASTFKQYESAAKILKRKMFEFTAAQVKPRDVAAVKKSMSAHPNMANRCLTVLRITFNYALEDELVESNPAIGIKPYETRKRTRLLSFAEVAAIYEKAGPRLRVIMDLQARTGKRISAVLKIRRADCTDDGMRFYESKTDTWGVVPWTPELREVYERAKTLNGNIRALTLLHNRRGKAPDYSTVKIQWDKARKAAGIEDARLNDMRAFAATHTRKQGKNATALLMHSSPSTTARYLRDKEATIAEGPSFGRLLDMGRK